MDKEEREEDLRKTNSLKSRLEDLRRKYHKNTHR